jgi:glycosyltransferase involved in cell wall biosynthesis
MSSNNPQVSVVIPAYNQSHFLAHAINSVLAQTYQDYEVIVVDDGSTDDTAAVAKQFGDAIRYIHQTNRGLSGARNTAIRNAKAEIIALLDSDDLWEPTFLEVMLKLLKQHSDAAGAYCGFQYINAAGEIVGKPSLKVVQPEKFHETIVVEGNWLAPCGVIFRKKLAEEIGLFDEALQALEDSDMWIRMSAHRPFVGLPQALVRYRRHGNNMSSDPERMVTASRIVKEKLFGSASSDVHTWSKMKILALQKHFLSGAVRYLAAGRVQQSADYLRRLARISVTHMWSLVTWRALVRAHLPKEYQFDPMVRLDWQCAQTHVAGLLDALAWKDPSVPDLQNHHARMKGGALLALADEAGRAKEVRRAFRWLWQATRAYPGLLLERPYFGTLMRITGIGMRK